MGALRALSAAALVASSFAALRNEAAQASERRLAATLRRPVGGPTDAIVARATDLGSVYGLAGTTIALAATGRRDVALDVGGAGLIAWAAAQGAKPAARRPRPYEAGEADRLVSVPAGSSWPSGHAAVAAAMGAALASHGGRSSRLLGAGLVAFVCVSRVRVGVHYPTDVAAGVGVGVLSELTWRGVRNLTNRSG